MSESEKEVAVERPGPLMQATDEDMLYLGSVHDDDASKAGVLHGESDMLRDILDIEASIMHSNAKSAKEDSAAEAGQQSTPLFHERAIILSLPSVMNTAVLKRDELSANSSRLSEKLVSGGLTNLQIDVQEKDSQTENQNEAGSGGGGDNASNAAERSQRNSNQPCNAKK